ncbi:uncharacterized protein LOC129577320 [Sitodiplosis mosellana]|uniref:uncharacterized protein LOC129577320 n=1 Tax=Sitodiplosis mosellana TaxID=263140 RepID=UPI0024450CFA|nr:uncharacterized protein LOC129577320 [Sitodiplosis mosellana]
MDYQDTFGNLRKKFYDRRKEVELLDDCIGEALTKRAVPITIALSAATYFAIREGFLKNNGIFGLMRKNFLCMCIGVGASLLGIRENYYDKLAIFYTSHRYQEVRNMIMADWKDKNIKNGAKKPFLQPNHLNLDLERPHFKGINTHHTADPNKDDTRNRHYENVTYEELQRKNREQYAIKHTVYY